MGFNSQSGQVGFGLQATRGTAVAATRFARLRSGSLGGDRALLVPDAEIGGNRDVPNAYLNTVGFSGDLEFYPRMQMIALLLRGVTGSASSTSVPGPPVIGTHVFTPGDTLPWLTIEERLGNEFESFQYVDGKVNSLRLEGEATGFLTGSANLAALAQTAGFADQATPAWDATPMIVGSQVVVSWNGVQLPAKTFNFEINNNIETDDFVLGSIYADDLTEKRRDIKAGISYRPRDADLWRAALYGSEAATSPAAGPAYRGELDITIETFETIGDVPAGTPFSLNINIPVATITPFKLTPSGDDTLSADLEFTAIRPSNATPAVTATVVNDLATVS